MQSLRKFFDKQAVHFKKDGKWQRFYALYDALDTFLFSTDKVTHGRTHIRDALDLKRMMFTVVVALIPCIVMGMYNVGYQAHHAIQAGALPLDTWQTSLFRALGFNFDASSILACIVHGALYYLPIVLMTFFVGGNCEAIFAMIRKHEINEGFLVTGMLFPLTLPPTIPLWQVALGIAFGVVLGKEVYGGTGMNFLNPALTGRAFLFFAYPGQISGDKVWIAANLVPADGVTGATWLAKAHETPHVLDQLDIASAFLGSIPGSIGETSKFACLLGMAILLFTRVASYRVILGVCVGTMLTATCFNWIGSSTNPMFGIPFYWHMLIGGWAFGTVFMATDPVSSAFTEKGKLIYGLCIGIMVILIRVLNPAYPEAMMLSILFMNMFAPLIDYFVVNANIKRRLARYGA